MKHESTLLLVLTMVELNTFADVKSDLLSLTGGREVKAVWLRIPWCDSSYKPVAAYSDDGGKHTQVCVLSTGEPRGVRLLDNRIVADHGWDWTFITRKDGSHVVWVDNNNKKSFIQAFDGMTPKADLNLGADYGVLSVHYNPATGDENLFVLSSDETSVYRIPLTRDYQADLTRKVKVIDPSWDGGANQVDGSFSVSGDGIMAGGAFPWPTTKILDMVNKKTYTRHAGTFGCNSNIAPDNSYRFFHFFDDHDGLHMFGPNLASTYSDFSLVDNLPGNTVTPMDCKLPRFTSDAQFLTLVYPGPFMGIGETGDFSLSAAAVKALNPSKVGHFCLGKFAADFKSIEKWALIAGGDVRNIEGTRGGLAWIGPTPGTSTAARQATADQRTEPALITRGGMIAVTFSAMSRGTVSILTPTGRLVAASSGVGSAVCAIGSQPAGTYIVKISTGSRVESKSLMIQR